MSNAFVWMVALGYGLSWAIIIAQQIFFMREIQQLVDKSMSRSYGEYVRAQEPRIPRPKPDEGLPEDLRSLQEFSINL